jgi:hypothetical protein
MPGVLGNALSLGGRMEPVSSEVRNWSKRADRAGEMNEIDHPEHYGGDTTYEAIKVIEAWGLNFNLGNAVKYVCRAGKKPGTSLLRDLGKAAWYLQREIQTLQRAHAESQSSNEGREKQHKKRIRK